MYSYNENERDAPFLTLADAYRTSMTNTYCVYTVLRYS